MSNEFKLPDLGSLPNEEEPKKNPIIDNSSSSLDETEKDNFLVDIEEKDYDDFDNQDLDDIEDENVFEEISDNEIEDINDDFEENENIDTFQDENKENINDTEDWDLTPTGMVVEELTFTGIVTRAKTDRRNNTTIVKLKADNGDNITVQYDEFVPVADNDRVSLTTAPEPKGENTNGEKLYDGYLLTVINPNSEPIPNSKPNKKKKKNKKKQSKKRNKGQLKKLYFRIGKIVEKGLNKLWSIPGLNKLKSKMAKINTIVGKLWGIILIAIILIFGSLLHTPNDGTHVLQTIKKDNITIEVYKIDINNNKPFVTVQNSSDNYADLYLYAKGKSGSIPIISKTVDCLSDSVVIKPGQKWSGELVCPLNSKVNKLSKIDINLED